MQDLVPPDPDFETRVRASFAEQRFMATLGAELTLLEPGRAVIEFAFQEELTQQHGFVHAGATTAIGDSAAGYAAFTLMPADSGILAVEFKVNLLAPAVGERFRAEGRVKRCGRRLTVCEFDVKAIRADGTEKVCLAGLHTSMCLVEGSLKG